jgi:hypothetical protein
MPTRGGSVGSFQYGIKEPPSSLNGMIRPCSWPTGGDAGGPVINAYSRVQQSKPVATTGIDIEKWVSNEVGLIIA